MTIGFQIRETVDGRVDATLLRPDFNDDEIPVSRVRWDGQQLVLAVDSLGIEFVGRQSPDRTSIQGTWTHHERTLPLSLRRVREITSLRRPQTPVPPFPYVTEDVRIETPEAAVTLAGVLTLPPGRPPMPAVVLVSGVGAHDRDYVILGHRRFAVLADHLSRNGFAVLRYDDRGVGGSTGDHRTATSEDFASDAVAAVAYLQHDERIDPTQIGILGHSEGGTVAALAASRTATVSFVLMISSPGLPGREYNLQFEASMGAAMGMDAQAVDRKCEFQGQVLDILLRDGDRDPARAREMIQELYRKQHPTLPEDRVTAALNRFLSPWFLFNIRHDPGQTLREVQCPVLAIIGALDTQVPPADNLAAIETALRAGGNQDVTTMQPPGLNHFLQSAVTGGPEEYGRIEETMAPAALDAITEWIDAHRR